MIFIKEIKEILPVRMRAGFEAAELLRISDIRFMINRPVILMSSSEEFYIGKKGICDKAYAFISEKEDIDSIVNLATENSLYSFLEDIKEGFITLKDGHRMGLCGTAVSEGGHIKTVKNISYINIRIAREIKGCSDRILKYLKEGERIFSTLVISPPGGGKTTLLRDIARNFGNMKNMRVSVIDSRFELGAEYRGTPGLDVGERSFLLSGYSKEDGFAHSVRSLSSRLIICDEIGGEADKKAVISASLSGASVIASAHGNGIDDTALSSAFERFILLNGREIRIYNKEKERIY